MTTVDLYTALALAQEAVTRYDVNVELNLKLANTARGTSAPAWSLTAKGNGIGAGEATGYGPSAEQAIAMLKRTTYEAWQTHQAAQQAARLARSQRAAA